MVDPMELCQAWESGLRKTVHQWFCDFYAVILPNYSSLMSANSKAEERQFTSSSLSWMSTTYTTIAQLSRIVMASILKPVLARQTCFGVGARRTCTQVSRTPVSAKTAALIPRNHSVFSRATPAADSLVRNLYPTTARIAAFHVSGKKAILPAEPR